MVHSAGIVQQLSSLHVEDISRLSQVRWTVCDVELHCNDSLLTNIIITAINTSLSEAQDVQRPVPCLHP